MIFIDTNYFVRALTAPVTDEEERMAAAAVALFRNVSTGQVLATTSDAVIAEVAYVLTGRGFQLTREDVASALERLFHLPGFKSEHVNTWTLALHLWLSRRSLSLVDALGAAYSMREGHELATFDRRLTRHPGLNAYLSE